MSTEFDDMFPNSKFLDIEETELSAGGSYKIYLNHWTGTPGCPATVPAINLSIESAEPHEIGGWLKLTPAQARAIAAKLCEAAEKLEAGWE